MTRNPRPKTASHPDPLFAPILEAFDGQCGVTRARMFGAPGLKADGKVFAMLVKGALVVKLPRARVDALVAEGTGVYFDPGHGRLLKEWIAVGPKARSAWLGLAMEARSFVASIP